MPRRIECHFVPGPSGRLEALLEEPEHGSPHLAVVLCHPHPQYGGTMHNKVVYRLARGLRTAGAVVLRFNFRGVGSSHGEYGAMAGEIEDARSALGWLRDRYPELPFALAGFSFGGRAVSELACSTEGAQFLLAAGFSTRLGGTAYLETCPVPKFFIQSTHDEFSPRAEFERVYQGFAEPKKVVWIEAADHFFAGALDHVEETVAELASAGDR
ncbi:MAG TPA: alpha/beta family hydrolase [Bryobacteraceae bacterium]|nr:alpha/beta family hydrolase [Bryobacteraceae bacterium]